MMELSEITVGDELVLENGAEGEPVVWVLSDPAGQSLDAVRPIRDDIEERVRRLLTQLGITPVA